MGWDIQLPYLFSMDIAGHSRDRNMLVQCFHRTGAGLSCLSSKQCPDLSSKVPLRVVGVHAKKFIYGLFSNGLISREHL